jgi:hypothetical protein
MPDEMEFDFSTIPDAPKQMQFDFSAFPDQPKPAMDADPGAQQSSDGAVRAQDLKPTQIRDLTTRMLDDAKRLYLNGRLTPQEENPWRTGTAWMPDLWDMQYVNAQAPSDTNTTCNINADTNVLESSGKPYQIANSEGRTEGAPLDADGSVKRPWWKDEEGKEGSAASAGSQDIPRWPESQFDAASQGRPLTDSEKDVLRPYIPEEDLNNAHLHVGEVPWYLSKDMGGITRGNDIYFRPGFYDPDTAQGISRLGHELVHVGQYRQGMNWATYLLSNPTGYDTESRYEKPAYDMEYRILQDLTKPPQ